MNRNQQAPSVKASGLRLSGNIVDRTRRHVPKDNPTTEIVTYTLHDAGERKFYEDDYAPESYHDIGDYVSFSVYVKPYCKKNGDASYNLCIQKSRPHVANISDADSPWLFSRGLFIAFNILFLTLCIF